MFTIDQHIRYLLFRHNYVVIPGLGAFVVESFPASYDEVSGRFAPPWCALGFNADLNHNDAMLASSVARRRGVSQQAAQKIVANEVEMMRGEIENSGSLMLCGIGELKSENGAVIFEPAADAVSSWRYQGLPVLQFDVPESAADSVKTLRVEFGRGRRWASIAASVAVLLGIGFMASTPVNVDNLHYAAISAPEVTKAHAVEIPAPVKVVKHITIMHPSDPDASAKFVPAAAVAVDKGGQTMAPVKNHYLIVASCSTRGEALRFIRRHSEDDLQIVAADGRFRVYISADNNRGVLELQKEGVAQRYPGAWLFSRV